jgi:cation:H+ antiporter
VLEEAVDVGRWRALATFVVSLAVLVLGSELLVQGAQDFVERFEITDTVFGMSVLALAVSVEEIARELPAARAGRPEISFGNVVGSVFAFFLLNAGVIALVRPVAVDDETRRFYLPLALAAVLIVSALVRFGTVSRLAGVVVVALYVGFFIGGYV